ncbi:MAG: sigma-70 family RNA polymerase sigma factor [Actinobacteria bacterium]|nr:sigma-70 family RNA polymerase sigma factor [Actinomycetota bacterium]
MGAEPLDVRADRSGSAAGSGAIRSEVAKRATCVILVPMSFGEAFEPILNAARLGEEWAWEQLYRGVAPSVLGYLRSRGVDDSEDLLGETFLQVVRDLPTFTGDERDFRAWLFTIAHHRSLDAVRRSDRRPSTPVDSLTLELAGPIGDAEEDAIQAARAAEIRLALNGVSEDQRNVLLLRLFGELTIDEIGGLLRKRPGAVKALQRRGLARLRKELSRKGVTP